MGAKSKKSVFLVSLMVLELGAMFFVSGCGKDPKQDTVKEQQHTVEDLRAAFEEAGFSVGDTEHLQERQLERAGAREGISFSVQKEKVGKVYLQVREFDSSEGLKSIRVSSSAASSFPHDNLVIITFKRAHHIRDADALVQALSELRLGRKQVFSHEYIVELWRIGPGEACARKLKALGKAFAKHQRRVMPTGRTSGEAFRKLVEEGYLDNRVLLVCPNNPIDEVDFNDPEGVGYYIDPDMPFIRHPKRAVAADRPPWEANHDGKGAFVLFEDGHTRFVTPKASGPPDKISNPFIEEDYDIYAYTGDPKKHAWIRWERGEERTNIISNPQRLSESGLQKRIEYLGYELEYTGVGLWKAVKGALEAVKESPDEQQTLSLSGSSAVLLLHRGMEHYISGLDIVVELGLSRTDVTDVELESLEGLDNLQMLDLSSTDVTDEWLVHLSGLDNLRKLDLSRNHVTDEGLVHLRGLDNLRRLDLSNTDVTDQGLEHLEGLANLQRLNLKRTEVTNAGGRELKEAQPQLEINIRHFEF